MRPSVETTDPPRRVPDAQEPEARDTEQELAGGRTAGTPAGVLFAVIGTIAVVVLVVLVLAVLAYVGTDALS
jgi:hypothetical protein